MEDPFPFNATEFWSLYKLILKGSKRFAACRNGMLSALLGLETPLIIPLYQCEYGKNIFLFSIHKCSWLYLYLDMWYLFFDWRFFEVLQRSFEGGNHKTKAVIFTFSYVQKCFFTMNIHTSTICLKISDFYALPDIIA